MTQPLVAPDPHIATQVAAALAAAGYTTDGVTDRLGHVAHQALSRGELTPARLALADDSTALGAAIRLLLLGEQVPRAEVHASGLPVAELAALGVLGAAGTDHLRAELDLRPHADSQGEWLVASDLGTDVRPGALQPEHVLGVGGASVTLAGATVPRDVITALDVGTGCGVQSLHLSRHARAITATDRSPRALAMARLTFALSGVQAELVEGDLLEPVVGRRFDLIVSNPPFVVSPGSGSTGSYTYRDSGLVGDEVSRRLVRAAPAVLTEGGVCQLLSNWLLPAGGDWRDRVGAWLDGLGCDAWVVQRDVQDPAEYVEMWLRDSGDEREESYGERYATWLRWLSDQRVEGVGFGLITLRRTDADQPAVVLEDLRQPWDQAGFGVQAQAWLDAQEWLRGPGAADLSTHAFRAAEGVRLGTLAARGAEGWEVLEQTLALVDGLARTEQVDTLVAQLVAGADGSATLGDQVAVLASAHGLDPTEIGWGIQQAVRRLVCLGFLEWGQTA